MARSVEDCALMLQALAGYDAADPASSREPVSDYSATLRSGVRGLKIGVPRDYFFHDVKPEVASAFEAAMQALRGLGAEVRDVTIPSIWDSSVLMVIMLTEAYSYHRSHLRASPQLYGDVLREKLLAGALFTSEEYVQAQRLRARLRAEVDRVLEDVDILATPTTPAAAPTFSTVLDPNFPFARSNMFPFNMTGLPTLALPCGFAPSGLPLSLQLSGRPFDEATVLRAGHTYEQATEWHRRRPQI
jgi:aspartyl-tRNA(Asn)/glutamyl-tRNA(Gln) amidotransferase subunit A